MNTQLPLRTNVRYQYRRCLLLFSIVTLALAAFAQLPAPARSYESASGTLQGFIVGDTRPGTPVPVGIPGNDTNIPTASNKGCVHGPGFWIAHPERWPAYFDTNPIMLGGIPYTKESIISFMRANGGNDPTVNLAFHLIAAIINNMYGQNYDGLAADIAAAQAILAAYPLGSNPSDLPSYGQLVKFNYGHRGQIHCNDTTGLPDLYTYYCQVVKNNKPACAEGYYSTRYEWTGMKWSEVRDTTICMTQIECQVPTDPNDTHRTLPADPFVTTEGLVLYSPPRYGIETQLVNADISTSCPVNEVLRAPYPRALVNTETSFFLQPNPYNTEQGISTPPLNPDNLVEFIDANGNPSELGYAAGIWKQLILTMRSRRFNGGEEWFGQLATEPQWQFDDRAWNDGLKEQSGATASYTYQTSSAGLSTLGGREYDIFNKRPADSYNLPAYNVDLTTSCGHEWKGSAQIAVRSAWVRTTDCMNIPPEFPPGWMPDNGSTEGCSNNKYALGYYNYYWQTYATGWAGVNMVLTGLDSTYDLQNDSVGGGYVNGASFWESNSGIQVPVIEVQSVLRDSCVGEGNCAPPSAPRSVNP